eukprot:TRINITY_DN12842_c0_g2_i1.p1 TRINITY_DN12842_c0_g2~~TRINITY_DN12842_c0_g2_i1.p1  ORF type:complete len:574 (+),score=47.90 TRINITY_DN12842_c0_g2_i1:1072-2793(+)
MDLEIQTRTSSKSNGFARNPSATPRPILITAGQDWWTPSRALPNWLQLPGQRGAVPKSSFFSGFRAVILSRKVIAQWKKLLKHEAYYPPLPDKCMVNIFSRVESPKDRVMCALVSHKCQTLERASRSLVEALDLRDPFTVRMTPLAAYPNAKALYLDMDREKYGGHFGLSGGHLSEARKSAGQYSGKEGQDVAGHLSVDDILTKDAIKSKGWSCLYVMDAYYLFVLSFHCHFSMRGVTGPFNFLRKSRRTLKFLTLDSHRLADPAEGKDSEVHGKLFQEELGQLLALESLTLALQIRGSINCITHILSHNKQLTFLDLGHLRLNVPGVGRRGWGMSDKMLEVVAQSCNKLEVLFCGPDPTLEGIMAVLEGCPKLRLLGDVVGTGEWPGEYPCQWAQGKDWSAVTLSLIGGENLRALHVRCSADLTTDNLLAFAASHPLMTEIVLGAVKEPMTSSGFVKAIARLPELCHLVCSFADGGFDGGFRPIAEMLPRHCPHLKTLTLAVSLSHDVDRVIDFVQDLKELSRLEIFESSLEVDVEVAQKSILALLAPDRPEVEVSLLGWKAIEDPDEGFES